MPKPSITIITGAGRGIGRAIALEHARQGATVALLARNADTLRSVADEIAAEGGAAAVYPVDVVDTAAVARTIAAVEADLGAVGLLINNAGAFGGIGPIWEVDPDVWWQDVETNIRGTFNCCRAVLPAMIARGEGRIINLLGGGTAGSFPMGSGYGTSKAGLLRFTESLSDSLAGTGVLAFGMDPGLVRTDMTDYQLTSAAGRAWLTNLRSLFERGIDVPPTRAAELSVEIGRGRFDRLAGRMLMAARGDIGLTDADIEAIVAGDLRSLRVNGMPVERARDEPPAEG